MPSKCKLLFDIPYLLLAPGLQGCSKSFQLDGDALEGAADRYWFIPRELYSSMKPGRQGQKLSKWNLFWPTIPSLSPRIKGQ